LVFVQIVRVYRPPNLGRQKLDKEKVSRDVVVDQVPLPKVDLVREICGAERGSSEMAFAGVSLIADGKLCGSTVSPIDAGADRGYHLLVVEGYSRCKGTHQTESA
jgi:hypothetical protein